MHIRRKLLSMVLVLAILLPPILPWVQKTALAKAEQTLTIDDPTFYEKLVTCLKSKENPGAWISQNDQSHTITFDKDCVKELDIREVNITEDNHTLSILQTLIRDCTSLEGVYLKKCNLKEFDFSIFDQKESLKYLYLVNVQMDQIPAITLPNLQTLCLSKNNLSATDACVALTGERFPALTRLLLDDCEISEVAFLKNMKNVKNLYELSLGDNKLTDDSVEKLIALSGSCLSGLKVLNLGKKVHNVGAVDYINLSCSNKFTDLAKLAELPVYFQKLESLELYALRITSLKDFQNVRKDVTIDFRKNYIMDFAGLEGNTNFNLEYQELSWETKFDQGKAYEIPDLIKRILDENDVLRGKVSYENCNITEDGKKLFIHSNVSGASVKVTSGRLRDSKITFPLKAIPYYNVPNNLTAKVGDILADVVLPEGFSWMDSSLDVGAVGTHVFKAVYTPKNTDYYTTIDNIDISVVVMGDGTEPTETPEPATTLEPTKTPEPSKTPEPLKTLEPSDTPEPTSTPTPSDTPAPSDSPEPMDTPKPSESAKPTLAPELPTPTPVKTPSPTLTPTVKPDESHQSGNQIEKRKDLSLQLAVGKQSGRRGIKLTWRKITNCSGYEVYWSYCDGKQNFKKLKTVKSNGKRVCVHKKLKKDRAYKYYIATYRIENGRKYYLSKSPSIHVAMKQESHTNAKQIKMKKTQVTLNSNQSFQIKAVVKKDNKKKKLLNHEKNVIRYYTDDRTVATVTKKGRIKARRQGVCTVYAIADNGVAGTVKVTVR